MELERLYESHTLGDAAVLLEAYRDTLADQGRQDLARALTGLEVYDISAAQQAIMVLVNLPVGADEPDGLRHYTILALERAIEQTRLTEAS